MGAVMQVVADLEQDSGVVSAAELAGNPRTIARSAGPTSVGDDAITLRISGRGGLAILGGAKQIS